MDPRRTAQLLSSLGLCGLLACGGDDAPAITAASLTSLALEPSTTMPAEDDAFAIEVEGRYSDASTADLSGDVVWSISDLAILRRTEGNRFRALSAGEVTVSARSGAVEASVDLTVVESPLVSIDLSPSQVRLEVGNQRAFRVIGRFANGRYERIEDRVAFTSMDPSVATVSGPMLEAVGAGSAEVEARVGDISDRSQVLVSLPSLEGLTLSPSPLPGTPAGSSLQLSVQGLLTNGTTEDYTGRVEWLTEDEAVAVFAGSPRGLLRAIEEGETTVVARDPESGTRVTASITVTPPALATLEVTPPTVSAPSGELRYFGAIGVYTNGRRENLTGQVRWSSSDSAVVRLSPDPANRGLANLLSPGVATISVRLESAGISSDDSGGSAEVTVLPPVVRGLVVEPATLEVAAGFPRTLRARASLSDGTVRDVSASVEWTSSSPAVATVAGGVVSTLIQGTTRITATDRGSGISASADVVVLPPELVSLSIDPPRLTLAAVGERQNLRADGLLSDGTTRDLTLAVDWSSDDPAVAVTSAGQVSGSAVALATVTARSRTTRAEASALVTVGNPLTGLRLTPRTSTIPVGAEVLIAAEGVFSNGETYDLTNLVQWTSSAALLVEPGNVGTRAGVARGLAAGRASLVASDASSGVSASATVAVAAGPTLSSLAVSLPTTSLFIGESERAIALGTFSDGNVYAMTHGVTWASSAASVVEVSNAPTAAGVVRTLAAGSAEISARHAPTGIRSSGNPTLSVRSNELIRRWSGPTVTVDATGAYGQQVGSITFTANDFGPSATITDVDITINFLKTDGSCASPGSGFAFHDETSFRLAGPGNRQVVLAPQSTWTGGTAISPVEVTFDQAAATAPTGTPQTGTFRPNGGNLNDFNGTDPVGTWVLEAGDSAAGDPLCVLGYSIRIRAR